MEDSLSIGDLALLYFSIFSAFWIVRDCRRRGGNHVHWGFSAYALSAFLIFPFYVFFRRPFADEKETKKKWIYNLRTVAVFYGLAAAVYWFAEWIYLARS